MKKLLVCLTHCLLISAMDIDEIERNTDTIIQISESHLEEFEHREMLDDINLSKLIVRNFYQTDERVASHLIPSLSRLIREESDSPTLERHQRALRLKQLLSRDFQLSTDDRQFIHDLIIESTKEAFTDQQKHLEKILRRPSQRWSRKESAVCASIAGVLSTIIIASATLTIHFSTQNCSDKS